MRLFVLYSQNHAARALPILFNTQKNPYSNQIFVPKKIPESKISNPKKSFDYPPPPPPGKSADFSKNLPLKILPYFTFFR